MKVTEHEELALLREMLYGETAKRISFPNIYAPSIVKLQEKVKEAIKKLEDEDGDHKNSA